MSKLQAIKKPCGGLTGDLKPTGKKIWRILSGSFMHVKRMRK